MLLDIIEPSLTKLSLIWQNQNQDKTKQDRSRLSDEIYWHHVMLHFLYLPPLNFDLWIMFGITHCGIYEFSTIDKGSLIPDQQALVGYLIGPQCVAKQIKRILTKYVQFYFKNR